MMVVNGQQLRLTAVIHQVLFAQLQPGCQVALSHNADLQYRFLNNNADVT
jgi:hypothetical protein